MIWFGSFAFSLALSAAMAFGLLTLSFKFARWPVAAMLILLLGAATDVLLTCNLLSWVDKFAGRAFYPPQQYFWWSIGSVLVGGLVFFWFSIWRPGEDISARNVM